jgi:uncharacterized membrane protein
LRSLPARVRRPASGYAHTVQPDGGLPAQVDDAIESIAELERKALASASLHQRAIERFTLAIGRPRTVYIIIAAAAGWIAFNTALRLAGYPQVDPPPYFWLDGVVALAALLMTILILTTENRMSEIEEQRARLHLQISMLGERKAAKLIQLLEELRYDLPSVRNRPDREAEEMTLPTDPHEVAQQLEKRTPSRGELPQD